MLFELIATFVVGLGVGGILLLVNKATRGRVPRGLVPTAAGLAMIAFTIWSEYSWFGRMAGGLPDGVEVAWSNQETVFYRPWTYLFPNTTRFLAVDVEAARRNPDQPGQKMVDLYLMGRWAPNRRVTVVMDCMDRRRADLSEGARFGPDGAVQNATWREVGPDDPVYSALCEQGRS